MSIGRLFGIGLLVFSLFAFACSADNTPDDDSSIPDGDVADGDQIDGDEVDGDALDGDDSDGDTIDGDNPDGDMVDGDDADGDAIDGDADEDDDAEFVYPDPAFIHEMRDAYTPIVDTLYTEEIAAQSYSTDQLPVLDVRDLAVYGDKIIAATADGVYLLSAGEAVFEPLLVNPPTKDTPQAIELVDIADQADDPKTVLAADAGRVWKIYIGEDASDSATFNDGNIRRIAQTADHVLVASDSGLYAIPNCLCEDFALVAPTENLSLHGVAVDGTGRIWLAADTGLFTLMDLNSASADPYSIDDHGQPDDLDLSAFRDVVSCGGWVAAISADALLLVDTVNNETQRLLWPGLDSGLPTGGNLALACNADGVLIGHENGATFVPFDGGAYDHYASGRWLPDHAFGEGEPSDIRVQAVGLGEEVRLLGTAYGASRVYLLSRNMASKQHVHDSYVDHFWRMDGFFSSDGYAPDAWNGFTDMTLGDKDNDGLWTQMMIGGWCFAYAATGDEKFYNYAHKAMENMYKLVDYPAITFEALGKPRGFIARSIVREDEGVIYTHKVETAEEVGDKGILRWNPVTVDGVNYLWKADTSSDELAGHFFGFPVYYDLCAKDDAERAKVASYAADVMGYIVDNGFVLIDLDGTRTTFGHWNPETISIAVDGLSACMQNGYELDDCVGALGGGGWLNSIEILGALLATWHMTGDKKFYDAYELLVTQHRYDEVAMANEQTYTITKSLFANHSDHELAMLAYTTLIRYEPNDERRARWIESLEFLYEWERPERNPWWAGVCALSGCAAPDLDSAGRTLREMPDDRREWAYDYTYRKDVKLKGNDRFGKPQMDRVLPFDEIRTMWWNGNPYTYAGGGNGREWSAPTAWLLPYYMHLYAGTIVSE
jgi:hypothetical protein